MAKFLSTKFKQNLFLKFFAWRKIPMLHFIRPKILEMNKEVCTIMVPFRRKSRNHLNSMYFAALSAGADCAGGMIAMSAIEHSGENVALIFKDFKAEFLKRAEGDVHFHCNQGKEIIELVNAAVSTGERVYMPVHVTAKVPSIDDEPVAEFILTLSLKKKP